MAKIKDRLVGGLSIEERMIQSASLAESLFIMEGVLFSIGAVIKQLKEEGLDEEVNMLKEDVENMFGLPYDDVVLIFASDPETMGIELYETYKRRNIPNRFHFIETIISSTITYVEEVKSKQDLFAEALHDIMVDIGKPESTIH